MRNNNTGRSTRRHLFALYIIYTKGLLRCPADFLDQTLWYLVHSFNWGFFFPNLCDATTFVSAEEGVLYYIRGVYRKTVAILYRTRLVSQFHTDTARGTGDLETRNNSLLTMFIIIRV